MGKTEVTHKALSPLRTLHEKLMGLTFIEPHIAHVAEIIKAAIANVPPKGNITGTDLFMLQGLVCLLRDSNNLLLHSQKLLEGHNAAEILESLAGNQNQQKQDELDVELPLIEAAPVLPEIPSIPAKPVLPNMGLW